MPKKLTKSEKKRMLAKYHRNEKMNYHTANAMMLIKRFGTSKVKAEAKRRYAQVQRQGYVSEKNAKWFYKKGHIHYKKLKN